MLKTFHPPLTGSQGVHDESRRRRVREAPFVFVAIFWVGLLIGVSFLATTVKFQAPTLDLPTALDVGRVTFALLSKVEWVLCGLLIATAFLSRQSQGLHLAGCSVLAMVLAIQALWLLPVLDARVGQIIAGATVPASNHHLLYITAEMLKALLLLGLSVEALRAMASSREPARCA